MQGNTSRAASSFSPAFSRLCSPLPHLLPLPPRPPPSRSFLTCACLCPCVLRPGIKRNTVWTQPMPSKFLAASWLHGMEYLDLSFFRQRQDTPVRLIVLNLPRIGYTCIYNGLSVTRTCRPSLLCVNLCGGVAVAQK